MFRSEFDIKTRIDLLLIDGDHVIGRWTAQFLHKGYFLGIPATGKQTTITGIDICYYHDGKIVEMWHQVNVMSLMHQLGVVPAPAPAADA